MKKYAIPISIVCLLFVAVITCLSCLSHSSAWLHDNVYTGGTITIVNPKEHYTRVDSSNNESDTGNYILFGTYPSTVKATDVTVSTTADSDGYYTGSDGEKYMKFSANPWNSDSVFSDGTTIVKGTAYYFKLEPIKWRILSESDGSALLLAESILHACRFDDGSSQSNNYADSEVRAFLNGYSNTKSSSYLNNGLLQTAFTIEEQAVIQTTTVDNSASTTNSSVNTYACEDTDDKLFLLSYQDLINTAYGFVTSTRSSTTRAKQGTDYAMANNLSVYDGNSYWWSRSPRSDLGNRAWCVNDYGGIGGSLVYYGIFGVVPALNITL